MNLRNKINNSLVNFESNVLLPLQVNNIIDVLKLKNETLSENEIEELKNFIENNEYIVKFTKFINVLNNDYTKINYVGLTTEEKLKFEKLESDIEKNSPQRKKHDEKYIKEALPVVLAYGPQKEKYKRIIENNKKYLSILDDKKNWTINLNDVKKAWEKQKGFANCDSEELVILSRIYFSFNTQDLIDICNYHKSNLSKNAFDALLSYADFLKRQILEIQKRAIESMMLRLELIDNSIEIHDDDVIRYTLGELNGVIQKNLSIELKKRYRNGLTFNAMKEFYKYISDYIKLEAKTNPKEKSISDRFYKLQMNSLTLELKNCFLTENDNDIFICLLSKKFTQIKTVIVESLLLESDHSLSLLQDLHGLMNESWLSFQSLCLTNKKYKNSNLEAVLEKYQNRLRALISYVCVNFENELINLSQKLIENILKGKNFDLSNYQKLKQKYSTFLEQYDSLLNNFVKPCNFLEYDLFYQLINRLIDNITDESRLNFSLDDKTDSIATAICQDHFWPINSLNNNSFQAAKQLMVSLLNKVVLHHRHGFYVKDKYAHYIWLLKYLESAFTDQAISKRLAQLALYYDKKSEDYFPHNYIIQDDETLVIPSNLKSKIEVLDKSDKKKLAEFFNTNQEQMHQYREFLNYIHHCTLTYVANCPLIDLFTFTSLINSKQDLVLLSNLYKEVNHKIEEFVSTITPNNKKCMDIMNELQSLYTKNELSLNSEWQITLLQVIALNTKIDDIQNYIIDSDSLVNIVKVQRLIDRVENNFPDHYYKSELLRKISMSCARILIDTSKHILNDLCEKKYFNDYIYNLTSLTLINSLGKDITQYILNDKKVTKLIKNKISQLDGSKSEIGSLITTMFTADNEQPKELIENAKTYATKRLQYIFSHHENDISNNDIIFFRRTKIYPEVKELYDLYKTKYSDKIKKVLSNEELNSYSNKIIALFGTREERSKYRLKCFNILLDKSNFNKQDLICLEELISFEMFHFDAVNSNFRDSDSNLANLVGYHAMNSGWNLLRDKIITYIDPNMAHLYHLTIIYDFLNGKNHQDLDVTLLQALQSNDPIDFLGQENHDLLINHLLMLLKVSYKSLDNMDLTNDEIDQELLMLSRIEKLKIMFEKSDALGEKAVLLDTTTLKKSFELLKLNNDLIKFTPTHGDTVDTVKDLIKKIIFLFESIENTNTIPLRTIKNVLNTINSTMKGVSRVKLDSDIDHTALIEMLNLQEKLSHHLKLFLSYLLRESYICDSDKNILTSMINWVDDNSEISNRKSFVIEMLQNDCDLYDIVSCFLEYAIAVNNLKSDTINLLDNSLINYAQEHKQGDNKCSLACAYISVLLDCKNMDCTKEFINYWFDKLQASIHKISLQDFITFKQYFCDNKQALSKLINPIIKNNRITSNTIFTQTRPTDTPIVIANIEKTLNGKCFYVDTLKTIYHYFDSKLPHKYKESIKNINPLVVFHDLTTKYYMNTEKDRLNFLKSTIGIKNDHRAKKLELLLQFYATVYNVFLEKIGKDEFISHLELILKKINDPVYKAHESKKLFEGIKNSALYGETLNNTNPQFTI